MRWLQNMAEGLWVWAVSVMIGTLAGLSAILIIPKSWMEMIREEIAEWLSLLG